MKEVNETVEKLSNENRDLLTQIEVKCILWCLGFIYVIQELFGITKDHENRKADIGYVDGLMKTVINK